MDYLNKSKPLDKKTNLKMVKQNFAPKLIVDKLPCLSPPTPSLELIVETNTQKCFYGHK